MSTIEVTGIMADASEVSVSNIFMEQIKTDIRNIRKSSYRRTDVKGIYQYCELYCLYGT